MPAGRSLRSPVKNETQLSSSRNPRYFSVNEPLRPRTGSGTGCNLSVFCAFSKASKMHGLFPHITVILEKYQFKRGIFSGVGTISTAEFFQASVPEILRRRTIMEDIRSSCSPVYEGVRRRGRGRSVRYIPDVTSSVPGVPVRVPVRLPEPDLGDRELVDPEPAERPLVLRAKPDLAGHPCRERQAPYLSEFVCEQVFVEDVRADGVPQYPDPEKNCGARLEDEEIVPEVRGVRVLLPPVAHRLRELFCIADGCKRFSAAGHYLVFLFVWVMGLWLEKF